MNITIDGKECSFRQGQTIYEVARDHGITIPVLCHQEQLKPAGACRVCVVEVVGARSLVVSCATPAEQGMIVYTDTERVRRARRVIVELLLAQGNHNCLTCEASGDCVLQDLAYRFGIEHVRFASPAQGWPIEQGNPMIARDMNKCVLCGLCVRACNELQVNGVLDYAHRGPRATVGPAFQQTYEASSCVFCGECVRVCPVGALYERQGRFRGRAADFSTTKTVCPYCGVGCVLELKVRDGKVIKVTTPREHADPPNYGSLCVKGRFGYDFLHSPDRLTVPLIRKNGMLKEVDWDAACSYGAERLLAIQQTYGPEAIAGLASARCTNEENYLFQKFMRAVMGTNNVDHCARLCHASTVAGLAASFGSGAMTNSIADLAQSDCFLVTGSNTTETHPVIGALIKRAVTQRGARLIVADPRRIDLCRFADLHLQQRPGTDIAWINGMLNLIIAEGLLNEQFIRERTEHFEFVKEAVQRYTPEYVERVTGIPERILGQAARIYAKANAAAILYAMGITQHTTGTAAVRALANLAMATGNIGRPGTGINPLRGQNNVQGACDMGCLPDMLPGYQRVDDQELRGSFEKAWGTTLPSTPGRTLPSIIQGIEEGKIKALVIMGENPLLSDPDLNHLETVFRRLDFLVVMDIFMSETAATADVVLPAAAWAEKEGTYTNTERRVQRVRAAIQPPGKALADIEIITRLAQACGAPWQQMSPEHIMAEINALVPQYRGITYPHIEHEGIHWPCPDTNHPGTPILHTERFTRGKGLFAEVHYEPAAEEPDDQYPLTLTTGRILYQYHTATMSRRSQGLLARTPEAFVEISPEDAAALSIADGEPVRVTSRRGSIVARAALNRRCGKGVVFMPFHYAEAAANRLTNAAVDPVANIPEFKVCAVRLDKVKEGTLA